MGEDAISSATVTSPLSGYTLSEIAAYWRGQAEAWREMALVVADFTARTDDMPPPDVHSNGR